MIVRADEVCRTCANEMGLCSDVAASAGLRSSNYFEVRGETFRTATDFLPIRTATKVVSTTALHQHGFRGGQLPRTEG